MCRKELDNLDDPRRGRRRLAMAISGTWGHALSFDRVINAEYSNYSLAYLTHD